MPVVVARGADQLRAAFTHAKTSWPKKNMTFLRDGPGSADGVAPPRAERVAAIHIRCGDFTGESAEVH